MALIPFTLTDFSKTSEPLITEQFKEKVVFNKYLQLLKLECQTIIETLRDLMQFRDIDSASGAQLDIIGDIVGQKRTLVEADLYKLFGFVGNVQSNSFGTLDSPTIGGYWWSYGTPIGRDLKLNDSQYRLLIKGKIIKNNSSGTNADMIRFGNFVLGTQIQFANDKDGKVTIRIGRRLSSFELAVMGYTFQGIDYPYNYTPKPLGIGISIEEYDSAGTLGFAGTPGAKGMISLSLPINGGVFANLYF